MGRKWLAVVCLAVVGLSLASVALAANPVTILVNGEELKPGLPALVEGRVLAPVRSLAEALGAEVKWDADSRTVEIIPGYVKVSSRPFAADPTEFRWMDNPDGLTDLDGVKAESFGEGRVIVWSQGDWTLYAVGSGAREGISLAREVIESLKETGDPLQGVLRGKFRVVGSGSPFSVTASWTFDGVTWYTMEGKGSVVSEIRRMRALEGQAAFGAGELAAVNRRIDLLEKALLPDTPEEVVALWAKGVKERNGALQFALLGPELRRIHEPGFKGVGWVTGVSSPWVDSYRISEVGEREGTREFDVAFHMMTSTGDAGTYTAKVRVEKCRDEAGGEGWRISVIDYPYEEPYSLGKAELPAYGLVLPLPDGWSWSTGGAEEVILLDEEENLVGKIEKVGGPYLPNHSEILSEKKVKTAVGEVRLTVLKRSYPAASGMTGEWEEVHALVPWSGSWLDLWLRVEEGEDGEEVAGLLEMMAGGIGKR